ncbi:FHA domain-containing protein [Lysobacter sp. CA199]|uniref:FHA domain-containing protein n=1 Tax=Lysobacter sp. CA199 TaxID=3455608 RepID=UPI003F8D1BF1
MSALKLRYPNREHGDLALKPGVHAIGRDSAGRTVLVEDPAAAIAQFTVDRRGVWLQVREGLRGLHVNGRPVKRMAMLRAGDAIFLDGVELLLVADKPESAPPFGVEIPADSRMVVRGVGGIHHGRCYTLEQPKVIGRAGDCDIRINEPAFADRHARLEAHADGVVLRDVGSVDGSVVNGQPVRHALLKPGDQLLLDGQHRFVIEAPTRQFSAAEALQAQLSQEAAANEARPQPPSALPSSVRRMPWLLLAAVVMAGLLGLLLLYGAR